MAAAGLSVLNVFVLGLVQLKRERAALRAIGVTSRQEQAVIIANAGLLGLLVAGIAVLGGVGLTYLWSLGSPVYYGIKIDWGVLEVPLRTGVAAVFILVLAAAVHAEDSHDLKTSKDRYSYALGIDFGKQLRTRSLDVDPELFRNGLKDALAGKAGTAGAGIVPFANDRSRRNASRE